MKIHDFSMKTLRFSSKINGKSWIFVISQGFLGNLGSMKFTPLSYEQVYSYIHTSQCRTPLSTDRGLILLRVLARAPRVRGRRAGEEAVHEGAGGDREPRQRRRAGQQMSLGMWGTITKSSSLSVWCKLTETIKIDGFLSIYVRIIGVSWKMNYFWLKVESDH